MSTWRRDGWWLFFAFVAFFCIGVAINSPFLMGVALSPALITLGVLLREW